MNFFINKYGVNFKIHKVGIRLAFDWMGFRFHPNDGFIGELWFGLIYLCWGEI